jgi:hypothetical protein
VERKVPAMQPSAPSSTTSRRHLARARPQVVRWEVLAQQAVDAWAECRSKCLDSIFV